MKDKLITFLCLGVTLFGLGACTTSKNYYMDSFVQEYYDFTGIKVSCAITDGDILEMTVKPESVQFCGGFLSDGSEKQKYEELCTKNNDLSFNREVVVIDRKYLMAYSSDISSLHLSCRQGYDENHPAGTSLADVTDIEYRSAYPYISSGYSGNVPGYADLQYVSKLSELEGGIRIPVVSNLAGSTALFTLRLPGARAMESGNKDLSLRVVLEDGRTFETLVEF